jgi:hypothetical protein
VTAYAGSRKEQAHSAPHTNDDIINIEAVRFLKLLDPAATQFEFRTFDDDKDRQDNALTRTFFGTLAQHAAELNLDAGALTTFSHNLAEAIGKFLNNTERLLLL